MIDFPSLRRVLPIAGQCGLILFGLIALTLSPPVSGRMLLVPLTAHARLALAPVAIARGARLVAAGPWAGSLLIEGRRDRLALPMLGHGVIAVATNRTGCGGAA